MAADKLPVLQGRTVLDYVRHVIDLADVLYALAAVYRQRRQSFRVGIGSICRRAQAPEIRRIVTAIAAALPRIPLHLFGAKLEVLKGWGNRPRTVISCDSAAWNGRFGAGIERFDAEQRRRGMSQRQFAIRVMLPRYAARVEAAFCQGLLPLEREDPDCSKGA